jgi:uncharacterized repeat protein (TIGR01451 family)
MKCFFKLRIAAALAMALLVTGEKIEAQSFGLGVIGSADSLLVSNSLTYTINVTNLSGVPLDDAVVTDTLPASVEFVSAIPSQGIYTTNGSFVVFDLGEFIFPGIAQISLTVQPNAAGIITNTVTVVAPDLEISPVTTNVLTQVTNPVPLQADLGVTVTGPGQTNIVNDWITCTITATNAGPSDATDVFLTNTLPTNVLVLAISPPGLSSSLIGSNLIFSLGTLPSGGFTNLQFTIQPTVTGTVTFAASIGTADLLDTNTANNFAATNLTVINYPAQLTAVTNSAQIVNQQNGLIEQSILVSNPGTNPAAAVRVVVTGLTNDLFNASGTNNGNPFVVCAAALATNQTMTMLLQYAPRKNFPFTNAELQAFAVPPPNLSPPTALTSGTSVNITRILELANGGMIFEFPATLGKTYTVVYADNILFSNALIAPPAIVAPANEVEWIDYGPPTTVSVPANGGARFYRVLANP